MKRLYSRLLRRTSGGQGERETALTYVLLSLVLHASALRNPPLPGWEAYTGGWLWVLLAGLAAMFARRKFPFTSALGIGAAGAILLGLGSIGGYFLIFESIFTIFLLAGERQRSWSFGMLTLGTLGVASWVWLSTAEVSRGVLVVFMAGVLVFTPMLWAQNIRTATELARSESARVAAVSAIAAAREDQLVAEHQAAVVSERTALAREMHDVLSARLASIALLSGAIQDRVPVQLREPIGSIRSESIAGLQELTSMVRMLHAGNPSALRADLASLPSLLDSFASVQQINFVSRFSAAGIPPAVQTAVYRTVRELLRNHATHAAGTILELSIEQRGDYLQVQASNPPGVTGHAGLGAGTGLANIRSRVQALGGEYALVRTPIFQVTASFAVVPAPTGAAK